MLRCNSSCPFYHQSEIQYKLRFPLLRPGRANSDDCTCLRQERLFHFPFNQVSPSVSATKPAPDIIVMNRCIPDGATLTVSPRQSVSGKVPGALSLRAASARPGCVLPVPAREAMRRRSRSAARERPPGLRSPGAPAPLRFPAAPLLRAVGPGARTAVLDSPAPGGLAGGFSPGGQL